MSPAPTAQACPPCSREDLLNSGWREAIPAGAKTSREVAAALRAASGQCESGGQRALRLLAEVLELGMRPSSTGVGPYFAALELDGARSFLPQDLNDSEVIALASFSEQLAFAPLGARLSDIAWLRRITKHSRWAERAIALFTETPLGEETWDREQDVYWLRAIELTQELGKAGEKLSTHLSERILDALIQSSSTRPRYVYDLTQLVRQLPLARTYAEQIASLLDRVSNDLLSAQSFSWAADLRLEAASWWSVAGNGAGHAQSLSEAVNIKLAEANHKCSRGHGPGFTVAPLFEESIEVLRQIPTKQRDGLRFEERMTELRQRLRESQAMMMDFTATISAPIPDAAAMAEQACNEVRGKSKIEALRAFVRLHGIVPKATLYNQAEANGREFLSKRLLSSRFVANDGRTTAKAPALPFDDEPSTERSRALHHDVARSLCLIEQVAVHTAIKPAQKVLQCEHPLSERDFIVLCASSPLVARERRLTVAKGLHDGFMGDYRTALYLLIPQLEHMVRRAIQSHGASTATITNGIEQEKALSSLMEMVEAKSVFGEDLALELYVLFCDSLGPNLRNELAHGLVNDAESMSEYATYAWWFMLRLILNPMSNDDLDPDWTQVEPFLAG